jgi:hypothetical protein
MAESELPERGNRHTVSDQGGRADDQGPYQAQGTSNFGALEQKVVNVEKWIDEIKTDIRKLSEGIQGLSVSILTLNRPQWMPLIAAATLFLAATGGVWKLAIQPLEIEVAQLTRDTMPKDLLEERRVALATHLADVEAHVKAMDAAIATIGLDSATAARRR